MTDLCFWRVDCAPQPPGNDWSRITESVNQTKYILVDNEAVDNEAVDNEAVDNEAVDNEAVDNEAVDNEPEYWICEPNRLISNQTTESANLTKNYQNEENKIFIFSKLINIY